MNLYIDKYSIPKTARNGRIYTQTTSTSGSGGGASVDTSLFVKYSGATTGQTIVNDLIVKGTIYAENDIVAYALHPATYTGSTLYTLPTASASVLGGVKIGCNLSIDSNGVLSSCAAGVSSWNDLTNRPSWLTGSTLSAFQCSHSHSQYALTSHTHDLSAYQLAATAWNTGNLNRSDANFSANVITTTFLTFRDRGYHSFGLGTDGNGFYIYDGNSYDYRVKIKPAGDTYIRTYPNYNFQFTGGDVLRVVKDDGSPAQMYLGYGHNAVTSINVNNSAGVGIGTSVDDGYKLNVAGTLRATDTYSSEWFRNTRSGAGLYNEANATGIYSDAYGQMRIYNTGKLRVDNTIDAYGNINMHNTWIAYANQVHLQDNGNGSIELGTYQGSLPGYPSSYFPTLKSSGNIHFASGGQYSAAITSKGFVATNGKQFVNDSTAMGYKSENYHGMVGDYDTNSTASKIIWTIGDQWNSLSTHYGLGYQFYSDFGHTYVVRENGNVNIKFSGTYGHIWGAGSLTMGGDITAFSSAKLKTGLQPITNVLDKIQNIQGYYYKRVDQQDNKTHIGLIAEDVQKEFPELVNNNNDTLSLNYQNYVAVLNEAIKDLSNKVKELERRVK